MKLTFPDNLSQIQENLRAQEDKLKEVATIYADAIEKGGVVHMYANGHSRVTLEETVVRMGALTGFHPMLSMVLCNFKDVIGADGLRVCQAVEKIEGLAGKVLDEYAVAEGEPLVVVTATGTTPAAVDMAIEFNKRYPENPLIAFSCETQSRETPPSHSSGKNLIHVVEAAQKGIFLNNGMPSGDLSVSFEGKTGSYKLGPLSSIGAMSLTHCLNELTVQILDSRGIKHPVLQNMHLGQTEVNYDSWLADQRKRYARATFREDALTPIKS